MPELCRFFGIIIRMDSEIGGPHRKIDPEVRTLVWPNGTDFDPATLHAWPEYVDALTERAGCWSLTPA